MRSIKSAWLLAAALVLGAPALAQKAAAPKPGQPVGPPLKMVLEPKALEILKAASDRLAAAKAMSFTAFVDEEYPSRLGPMMSFPARYDVTMQRPDKLRVLLRGAGPESEFYLDGKTMLAYAPAENLVAVADAPPALADALQKAHDQAGIFYPFTDLLLPDPYEPVAKTAKLAFYVGRSGAVGGVETDMVAWANDDVFMQIWTGVDDKLPRRVRAVYRNDPMQFRHEMSLTDWKIDPAIADGTFTTLKAAGAQKMPFAMPSRPPQPKAAAKSPSR
ncbi:MAG: DUF2092 domain-containing protein [Burkholderiales bacterium]|nr:DUF2092 domain-containing protein [Burkholderiales bacterium]